MDTYEPGRIVIGGSTGLIGTALVAALQQRGVPTLRLMRSGAAHPGHAHWDPARGELDPRVLDGAAAVVNLGGASISKLPWTRRYQRTILRSRLEPTGTLVKALRKLGSDRPALLSASAVGYYGNAPGVTLTEEFGPGSTFLADVCVQWERAAQLAENHTRVALLRTAPVIDTAGFLKPIIALTKLGVAGPLGKGTQFWPWISLQDEVAGILHVLDSEIEGPVNLTGPVPATANELGKRIAADLGRSFWLKTPEFVLKSVLGRHAANSLLLSDARLLPEVLENSGFTFADRTVQQAVDGALEAAG